MDYTAAAIILFCVMIAANMYWLAGKITNIEKMLNAIAEGGKIAMPKVNDGMRSGFELTIAALNFVGGKIAELAKPKRRAKPVDKDYLPLPQEVDESLVKIMARYILNELDTKLLDEVDLSESKWIRRNEWKIISKTGTPEQWRAVMDKLEDKGVVERKGAKRTRVLSASRRPSVDARLRVIISPPPKAA